MLKTLMKQTFVKYSLAIVAATAVLSICALADTSVEPAPHDFMINNAPLKADELRAAFKGQTHVGSYRFEREKLSTYTFSETTFTDGRVEHRQGDEVLAGNWEISGDQICFTYENVWYSNLCFSMYRNGNCYYHYLMTEGGRTMRVWTARSSLKGERPNCEPNIS